MTDAMDSFLAFEQMKADIGQGKDYPHRDEIPPALLAHADNYVKLTGQTPDKRNITDWIAEFTYWETKGLHPQDIERTWREAEFFVTRPGSLTDVAVAMKAKRRATYHKVDIFRAANVEQKKYVPMPEDVKARLDAKLKQDRVGTSTHEPKPISEVMKGL